MSQARLLNVLCAPVISEKSSAAHEKNTLVFKVLKNATKDEIKAAVETKVKFVALHVVLASVQTGKRLMLLFLKALNSTLKKPLRLTRRANNGNH